MESYVRLILCKKAKGSTTSLAQLYIKYRENVYRTKYCSTLVLFSTIHDPAVVVPHCIDNYGLLTSQAPVSFYIVFLLAMYER